MDLNDMQMWHWLAILGGVVMLFGIGLYFLPVGRLKVPAVVTTAFGSLGAGLALGIIYMAGFGYKPNTPELGYGAATPEEKAPTIPAPKIGGGGAFPKGKAPGIPGPGAGPGGGPGGAPGGGGPSPRLLLASLVNSLETLAEKPVALTLTPEERRAIADILRGLDTGGDIEDEKAREKVDAIQKIVSRDRKSLETVGYRWVTDGKVSSRPFPKDSPNPFKGGAGSERFKRLMSQLEKQPME